MDRKVIACLVLAATLVGVPSAMAAGDPYREVSLSLGQELVAFFPPAEGYVVSESSGEVFIDLAERDLMRPGMELLVYRPGNDIVHPVTGGILGKYEETVGYLILREVREKYSSGLIAGGATAVKAGDRVRITARRLRALLLISGDAPDVDPGRLAQDLASMSEDSGRFRILDEPEWQPALKAAGLTLDEVLADTGSLRRLGAQVPADLLFIVRPRRREGAPEVLLEVRSLGTGLTLVEFQRPWPSGEAEAMAPVTAPPPDTGPSVVEYLTKELSQAALLIVAEDLDRDGNLEILLTDGRGLTIFQWDEGGLIWKWEEPGISGRHVLNLEAGDVDNDGRPEIYTTTVGRGRVQTVVWSWGRRDRENLAKVEGVFLKVVDRPGGGKVLFGQRFGLQEVFSGPVEEYVWKDGTCQPAGRWVLPRGVNLFGLGLADLNGDGQVQILSLDESGRLRVFTQDGRLVWQSEERYGGYPVKVSAAEMFGPFAQEEETDEGFRSVFQGRVLTGRGKDGMMQVVIPRNFSTAGVSLPRFRLFSKGEVVFLKWEGSGFTEVQKSRSLGGYISDIAWCDMEGNGRREIMVTVNRRSGLLFKERGKLVVWRHPG